MTQDAAGWDERYSGDAPPPWDIGRPQPRFAALADTGAFRGRLLDCGCGTGEHALLAASLGADVTGIDLSPLAIEQARRKAESRGLSVWFEAADALRLSTPDEPFDVVIDSGVFHSFEDADRARYVDGLRRQLRVDGWCYLMCFSDRQPGDWGPRRVHEAELRQAFADGWDVRVEPAVFEINEFEGVTEVQAWFAALRRTE
jgi:cyclopropane fatty-acyl-phospholipid synthase-like methyltransferase